MKKIYFCLPAILGVPLFGAHASGKETPEDDGEKTGRPNVLFLLTDDQTFNTIRALGNTEIHTPNMDRLLRRGVAFTQTHVMGGLNGAVSQPSRAMLLTGRGLMDGVLDMVPGAKISVVGLYRNEETLEPGEYYVKREVAQRQRLVQPFVLHGGEHLFRGNASLRPEQRTGSPAALPPPV